MDMLSNEMLYKGGLAVAAAAAALLVIFLVCFAISGIRLKYALDGEYGKKEKPKKRKAEKDK